jgi:hypothetical protein
MPSGGAPPRAFDIDELCVVYYQALGFTTRLDGLGADGGVNIVLSMPPAERPFSVARCKSNQSLSVTPTQ